MQCSPGLNVVQSSFQFVIFLLKLTNRLGLLFSQELQLLVVLTFQAEELHSSLHLHQFLLQHHHALPSHPTVLLLLLLLIVVLTSTLVGMFGDYCDVFLALRGSEGDRIPVPSKVEINVSWSKGRQFDKVRN